MKRMSTGQCAEMRAIIVAEFIYRAITDSGREKKGNIVADDADRATAKLKAMGLMPLELKKASVLTKEINITFGRLVNPRDLSVFCRQFVSMLNAGITIIDALNMLSQQTENKHMAKALLIVQSDIEKGETLSDSMRKHEKIFPSIMISMVAAGEASGKLETTFEHMAGHFEKDARIRGMLKKAAMYPIVVAVVAVIVMIVMLVKVVPSYMEMFEQMDVEMPGITLAVIAMSNFIQKFWYLLILIGAGIVAGIRVFKKTEYGETLFGNMSRKMPIFGKLNIKTSASIFARTLGTLLYSGLPMVDGLEIVANTMPNVLYQKALKKAREEVIKGVPLSEPLEGSGLFPPMVAHMIRIGEETGDVEEMLDRLSGYYDEEVEMATQTVMAALEPMIIIIMALIVIVLIAAVMAPMLAMYGGLDNL